MRIMAAYFKVGLTVENQTTNNFQSWSFATTGKIHPMDPQSPIGVINQHVDVRSNHGDLIRNMAARSTVLLKNENNALPLKKPRFLAVVGEDASVNPRGSNACPDRGCSAGTTAQGWGSGSVQFPYLVSPEVALQQQAILDGSRFEAITDNYANNQIRDLVSQEYATAIVFVDADAGEGYIAEDGNEGDRKNLTLWHSGDQLVKNVSSLCNNTIVVIYSPGPVLLTDHYDNPNITAILWSGFAGQEAGNSITDVLYGKVNPAARSPFTWGKTREDYGTDLLYEPNNGNGAPQVQFREGVFIDYRHFDKQNITPIYEFGHGLSYTTFNYSNLQIEKLDVGPYTPTTGMTSPAPVLGNYSTNWEDYQFPEGFNAVYNFIYPYLNTTDPAETASGTDYGLPAEQYIPPNAQNGNPQPKLPSSGAPGGNPGLYDVLYHVSVDIESTGDRDGEEVPQLYVSLGGQNDPPVVLRNFGRLSIGAGEKATWTADIQRRDLAHWNVMKQDWVVEDTQKTLFVGPSSRKLVLRGSLE